MHEQSINPWRILWKTCIILFIINFAFPFLCLIPFPEISLYNTIFPGRERLPFGETPELAYNLTLNDIDAMLASHIVAASNEETEISIFVMGDSSIWGTLLENDETVSAKLQNYFDSDVPEQNDPVEVYNLGYPTSSVLKDLVILDQALQYKPNMVIWFVTLNSLAKESYKEAPLLLNNPEKTNEIISKYELDIPLLPEQSYWDRTFLKQRRNIYDRIHLQMVAPMWASTGIDQYIPIDYTPAARDLEADDSYEYIHGHTLSETDLELSVITNFVEKNPDIQVIVINEPILISRGMNSDIRYNLYYPRRMYDEYRVLLSTKFKEMEIKYIDLWDAVPESMFTNSAIHYDEQGVDILTEKLYSLIKKDWVER
ncbi:MAG: SGNH/GDSL hydrolase family protein [Anaerolineaceae bacterium]|jgi:hypothetical protein|nr:MAG: SGNH/GDSL hydrolase family protein [Anaerolineaceae bacterium]